MRLGSRFDGIVEQKTAVGFVLLDHGLDVELVHRIDNGLGALNEILENRRPVVLELLLGISAQMDNLHLLDNRRLSALAGA